MTSYEKKLLTASLERLIRDVAIAGGYRYSGDCGEYRLTPFGTRQCPEVEIVIYNIVNALGSLESIPTED